MTIQAQLLAWASEQTQLLGVTFTQADPLKGDAGFRRYVRLNTNPAMLAVYGPPATEKHDAFVQIAHHWQANGLCTPKVYAFDGERGFLLIADLGATSLSDVLVQAPNLEAVAKLYAPVFSQLRVLQQLPPAAFYPPYSRALLLQEMALFAPWFVESLLGHSLASHEQVLLNTVFDALIHNAVAQPQVIVHRDLHCRNIQCAQSAPPKDAPQHFSNDTTLVSERCGFIDFQDAVLGPITYDWVSLLKDCYQLWPAHFVNEQLEQYNASLPKYLQIPPYKLQETFDLMGLQRHIKVLGIFARLSLRDGKADYLNDLPTVIAYVRDVCQRYSAFKPFAKWFDEVLLPQCALQPWYHAVEIRP